MKRAAGILLVLAVVGLTAALSVHGLRSLDERYADELAVAGGSKSIDEILVKALKGEAPGDRGQAERQVVEGALALMGLTDWQAQSSLKYQIVFGDVYPGEGEELIAAISLGKDRGAVGVFARRPQGYVPVGVLKELVPVTRVGTVGLPGLPYKAMVVDQYLDEMFGAFYEVKTKAVFVFRGSGWEKAWERDRYRREYYPEGNEQKGNQTRWLMLEEKVNIVFRPEGRIEVTGVKTWGRSKMLGVLHGDYEVTGSKAIKESYVWDKKKAAFQRQ